MKNFHSFITEEHVDDGDIQIAILTKASSKEKEIVANQIKEYSDKNNISCHIINTKKTWVATNDVENGVITILDMEGNKVDFKVAKTVIKKSFSNQNKIFINSRGHLNLLNNGYTFAS